MIFFLYIFKKFIYEFLIIKKINIFLKKKKIYIYIYISIILY